MLKAETNVKSSSILAWLSNLTSSRRSCSLEFHWHCMSNYFCDATLYPQYWNLNSESRPWWLTVVPGYRTMRMCVSSHTETVRCATQSEIPPVIRTTVYVPAMSASVWPFRSLQLLLTKVTVCIPLPLLEGFSRRMRRFSVPSVIIIIDEWNLNLRRYSDYFIVFTFRCSTIKYDVWGRYAPFTNGIVSFDFRVFVIRRSNPLRIQPRFIASVKLQLYRDHAETEGDQSSIYKFVFSLCIFNELILEPQQEEKQVQPYWFQSIAIKDVAQRTQR